VTARRWVAAGLLFAVVWVLVTGSSLAPASLAASFLVGLAVGLPVAYVFRRLYGPELAFRGPATALLYTLLYALSFGRDIVAANVDVAYRVLAPEPGLEPQVILVPLRVETALGVTTIANSITLTPGTLALDYDPAANALYVHGIDGRDPEAIAEPIRDWEDYALRIFDEPGSPDDPAPEITVHPPDHPPEPTSAADHLEAATETRDREGSADAEEEVTER